jgi:phosphoribosylformimino-5-aminoimidazole carboxamide ribotide isomerase
MYPEHTIEQVKLGDDDTGLHLGLYTSGTLCTIVSLFKNDGLQFRKFATVTAMQGRGFGSALLQHVFHYAKENKFEKIWCNARTTALPFYARFGMQPFGDSWEQHGRLFVRMKKEL